MKVVDGDVEVGEGIMAAVKVNRDAMATIRLCSESIRAVGIASVAAMRAFALAADAAAIKIAGALGDVFPFRSYEVENGWDINELHYHMRTGRWPGHGKTPRERRRKARWLRKWSARQVKFGEVTE